MCEREGLRPHRSKTNQAGLPARLQAMSLRPRRPQSQRPGRSKAFPKPAAGLTLAAAWQPLAPCFRPQRPLRGLVMLTRSRCQTFPRVEEAASLCLAAPSPAIDAQMIAGKFLGSSFDFWPRCLDLAEFLSSLEPIKMQLATRSLNMLGPACPPLGARAI